MSNAHPEYDPTIEDSKRAAQESSSRLSVNASRVKKTLDRLAYASLILDICIAVITAFSIFGVSEPQHFLVPVNYLLTIVVILSVIMFALLFLLRAKERQAQQGSQ
jgi:hypothetical protein